MLGNGTGKARATRNGGARDVATWSILFLSTGEASLADKTAESGKRARAGQSARVIDIPADAGQGFGIFAMLHGSATGAALADHLRRSGEAHSGHAARTFLERITKDSAATIKTLHEYMSRWLAVTVPSQADGQVGRVAARLALVAAAGELAAALDILPWPASEASAAAARCFADWLAARGGHVPEEIAEGIRRVRSFLEMHGSSRFKAAWQQRATFPETHAVFENVINRAGFRKLDEGAAARWEFYILPEPWRTEVCAGFDASAIAKALITEGLKAGDETHQAQVVKVPGVGSAQFYRIAGGFLAEDAS
jgi:uncharacterized protein (DUF927 family)